MTNDLYFNQVVLKYLLSKTYEVKKQRFKVFECILHLLFNIWHKINIQIYNILFHGHSQNTNTKPCIKSSFKDVSFKLCVQERLNFYQKEAFKKAIFWHFKCQNWCLASQKWCLSFLKYTPKCSFLRPPKILLFDFFICN